MQKVHEERNIQQFPQEQESYSIIPWQSPAAGLEQSRKDRLLVRFSIFGTS